VSLYYMKTTNNSEVKQKQI